MLATLPTPVLILRHRYCYGLAVHVLVLVLLLTLHLQLTHAALLPGAKITKYLQQHRNIDLATIEPILAVAEKAHKSWNNPCPTLFYDPYVAYSVLDAFSDGKFVTFKKWTYLVALSLFGNHEYYMPTIYPPGMHCSTGDSSGSSRWL